MSHLLDQFRFFKRKKENSPMDMARPVMNLVRGRTRIAVAGSMTKLCAQRMGLTVLALAHGKYMSKTV